MKTIRNKIRILIYNAVVIASMAGLSGCSSSDDDSIIGPAITEQGGEEMRFSAEVGTRLFTNVDDRFQDGDSVRLWVDDCQTTDMDMATTTPKAHVGYTVFDVNTSTKVLTQRRGAVLKYPTSGNRVNIYAMRINTSTRITDGTGLPASTGILHSVLTDQTTKAKYCQSDMMYGELKYQKHTTNKVAIPFKHALAKITLRIGGDNMELQDNLSRIQILETQTQALITINRSKGYGISSRKVCR